MEKKKKFYQLIKVQIKITKTIEKESNSKTTTIQINLTNSYYSP